MKLRLAAAVVALTIIAAALPASGHHAFAAEYDNTKPLNIKGKFISMDWINPHSWVHFEVTLPDGQKQVWHAETPPPNQLVRMGWSKTVLQAGDEIQVAGAAAKDGTTKMWASNVSLLARDGKALEQPKQVLNMFAQNPDAVPAGLLPPR
jgi:Family of unknown function (DUF6152)